MELWYLQDIPICAARVLPAELSPLRFDEVLSARTSTRELYAKTRLNPLAFVDWRSASTAKFTPM